MIKYRYKARTKESTKTSSGTIEAANQNEAIKKLRAKGMLVLTVQPDHSGTFELAFLNRVKTRDRIIFAKELSVMIKAGLPILQALRALEQQTTNKTLKKTITTMIGEIDGGTSLSEAFSHHEKVFPPIFVSVCRIGEKSGKLELVLERLAVQLEKDDDLVNKVKGAMIYPSFVMVTLVSVMILIVTYIIPQLKTIFDDANVALPLMTRILLKTSDILRSYGIIVAIAVVALVIGIRFANRLRSVRIGFERLHFLLPVFGKLHRQVLITRFTSTLATLLNSGLPMLEAIKTTSQVVNSPNYEIIFTRIAKDIENGGALSKSLIAEKEFPPMVGQMVAIGENSGSIDTVLETISGFFDKEAQVMAANLSTLLEPILMIIMGVGVGLVISSVILPIYGLVNAV